VIAVALRATATAKPALSTTEEPASAGFLVLLTTRLTTHYLKAVNARPRLVRKGLAMRWA
jgi:hypothetical protein